MKQAQELLIRSGTLVKLMRMCRAKMPALTCLRVSFEQFQIRILQIDPLCSFIICIRTLELK